MCVRVNVFPHHKSAILGALGFVLFCFVFLVILWFGILHKIFDPFGFYVNIVNEVSIELFFS